MSSARFVARPGTVQAATNGHGRSIGVIDLDLDGVLEVVVFPTVGRGGFSIVSREYDGSYPLHIPMLNFHYNAQTGLSLVNIRDQNGQPLRGGEASDLVFVDFNNDGHLDLLISDTGPEVFINGRFPGASLQLLIAAPGGPTVINATASRPNTGEIATTSVPGTAFWHSAGAGDINGDGFIDFMGTPLGGGSFLVSAFFGDGRGGFTYVPHLINSTSSDGQFPSLVGMADLSGDGRPDLFWGPQSSVAGRPMARENRVYVNTGTGFADQGYISLPFPSAAAFAASGHNREDIYTDRVRFADLNGDGLQDIMITYLIGISDDRNTNAWGQVWIQNPDHTFRELHIWENNRLQNLLNPNNPSAGSMEGIDVNGDGLTDIMVTPGPLHTLRDIGKAVWINMGDGTFQSLFTLDPDLVPDTTMITSAWFQDMDGDGRAEILASVFQGSHLTGDYYNSRYISYGLENAPIQAVTGQPTTGSIFADLITGTSGDDHVNAGLGHDVVNGGLGNDTLRGEFGNDLLAGEAGDDLLYGGGGADTLTGGAGNDRLEGGDGIDAAAFTTATAGVTASLATGLASGEGADILVGIENLTGSDFDDTLTGDQGANRLAGGGGNDLFTGGAGDDVINGGTGLDTVVFSGTRASATISYSGGAIVAVSSDGRDTLMGIETLRFSDGVYDVGADGRVAAEARRTVAGTAASETLTGGGSNDIISGGAGNDLLRGGGGSDLLDGGAGFDAALYAGARRQYIASSTAVSGNGEGSDTLTEIEEARFTDGVLTFDIDSRAAQVMRLYDAALDRQPDPSGFEAVLDLLEGGQSLEAVAGLFLASAEFQARYAALNNQQFVEQLYRFCLDREGDPGGVAGWVNALNSGASRTQLLVLFSESAEHRVLTASTLNQGLWVADDQAIIIARMYDATFDRLADAGGLAVWTANLKGGMSLIDIATAFAGAAEFQQRYGSVTNEQFIDQMYRFSLNRAPDAGGLAFWVNALNTGTSRAQMLLNFSESAEHAALTRPLWLGGIQVLGATAASDTDLGKDGGPQVLPGVTDEALPGFRVTPSVTGGDRMVTDGIDLPDPDAFVLSATGDDQSPLVLPGADDAFLTVEGFRFDPALRQGDHALTLALDPASDLSLDDLLPWPDHSPGHWLQ